MNIKYLFRSNDVDTNYVYVGLDISEGVHLCGSSMGAIISEIFAIKYPQIVKTLILCVPTAYYSPKVYDQNVLAYDTLRKLDSRERVEHWFPLMYSREFRKRLKQEKELYDQIRSDIFTNKKKKILHLIRNC